MKIEKFNKRVWLNTKSSPSTGSAVAWSGPIKWNSNSNSEIARFFEVSDCHTRARLHQTVEDSDQTYINKMRKLRQLLKEYIEYLEQSLT